MMPCIGKVESLFSYCYSGWYMKSVGRATPGCTRPFVREIGLPKHEIGGLMIAHRELLPDQHPMIAGVNSDQTLLVEVDTTWRIEIRRRGACCR